MATLTAVTAGLDRLHLEVRETRDRFEQRVTEFADGIQTVSATVDALQ